MTAVQAASLLLLMATACTFPLKRLSMHLTTSAMRDRLVKRARALDTLITPECTIRASGTKACALANHVSPNHSAQRSAHYRVGQAKRAPSSAGQWLQAPKYAAQARLEINARTYYPTAWLICGAPRLVPDCAVPKNCPTVR